VERALGGERFAAAGGRDVALDDRRRVFQDLGARRRGKEREHGDRGRYAGCRTKDRHRATSRGWKPVERWGFRRAVAAA
jgi:hypothetical protein